MPTAPAVPVPGDSGPMALQSVQGEYQGKKMRVTRGPKYYSRKTSCGSHTHDSAKEARRCGELQMRVKAGEIVDLKVQPEYEIIVNGVKVCKYVADFGYVERRERRSGGPILEKIVEDVKSEATRKIALYGLKKKLLKAALGIEVREV